MPEPDPVPASTDSDLLPIVDEQDNVIGKVRRAEVHASRLRHRSVHIVILNSRGEVLLQKRSNGKDMYPGWWDISVGGHVDVGEEYDTAAKREMKEEMGIDAEARFILKRGADEDSGWEFVQVYECIWDEDLTPDNHEIETIQWVDITRLLSEAHSNPEGHGLRITGSGLLSLQAWAVATGRNRKP